MARHAITEGEVRIAIERLDPVGNELFPDEQAPIVQVLVERIHVDQRGLEIRLNQPPLIARQFGISQFGCEEGVGV
jgi:hypothetical protein